MLFAALGCARQPPPDVLLVTVDTLRPDAVGWVAGKNATPALDRLAATGFAFPGAVAPIPITLPSHTALFAGRVPRATGVRDNGDVVPDDLPLLADRLRAAGYRTGAVVSGYPLRRPFGLDRGFASYDDRLPLDRVGDWAARPADEAVRSALRFLDDGDRERPWFLWLHFYDPHDPYEPPARFAGSSPRAAYDGEVRFVDEAVATLESELARRFAGRPRLTVFTADHGESLGEHDEETHGFFVYDSTVLVPLVIALPGAIAPGRSQLPARLVDVAPTVLDLLGLAPLAGAEGESLRPILAGQAGGWRAAYVESLQPFLSYGWAPLAALRTAEAKYVRAPRSELYDLVADPGETRDLHDARGDQARQMARDLASFERAPERSRFAAATAADAGDAETARALAALGYLGRGAEAPAGFDPTLADPKDRTALRRDLLAAERLAAAGDRDGASAAFAAVLAAEPDNRYALLRLGVLEVERGRPAQAMAPLLRLARLDPLQPEASYQLAVAAIGSGDFATARAALEHLVTLQPRRAAAWSHLALARYRTGNLPGAVEAGERAAALEPGDPVYGANLRELRAAAAR
jgi:arylsulfatase A-like enzyme